MQLSTWCKDHGYTAESEEEFIQQIKKKLLRLEIDLFSANENIKRQWQRDQMDMVRAHLEAAINICMQDEGEATNGD